MVVESECMTVLVSMQLCFVVLIALLSPIRYRLLQVLPMGESVDRCSQHTAFLLDIAASPWCCCCCGGRDVC